MSCYSLLLMVILCYYFSLMQRFRQWAQEYVSWQSYKLANGPTTSTQLGSSPMVSLDFPAALSQRVINALKADPNTVDLRAQAPHFYALGSRILELFEEEEIVDVLLEVREPYLFIDICAWLSQH